MGPDVLYGIGLIAVPLLLSLTLHEYGHARTAQAFGDHTARLLGRCTLNPLAHLHPVGTLCFFFGPIGWAKPVPVDFSRLRPARLGDIAVSVAGVGMNLVLAGVAVAALYGMVAARVSLNPDPDSPPTVMGIAAFMVSYALVLNLSLLVFNLIPLFPLDGHHVVRELLPWNRRAGFMAWQGRAGGMLLLALLAVPWVLRWSTDRPVFDPVGMLLGRVVWPAIDTVLSDPARDLFGDAMYRYGRYLSWYR